jgi:AraC-like DNA-binding protein
MERTEKAIAAEKNVQKLKTVLLRIEKDYDKKLTVDQMADECGYSSSHFMRWFKEITGSGFAGYLIEYRLGKAALALRDTNDTILDISERNGFDNLSNFNRLFKKKYEMTPSQFRQHSVVSPTGQ